MSAIGGFTNTTVPGTLPTGSVDSTEILDGTIIDADVNATAAIALSKLASLTAGSIAFAGSDGKLTQDNSNLVFDDTNNVLLAGASSLPTGTFTGVNIWSAGDVAIEGGKNLKFRRTSDGSFIASISASTGGVITINSNSASGGTVQIASGNGNGYYQNWKNLISLGKPTTTKLSQVTVTGNASSSGSGTVSNSAGGTTVTGSSTQFTNEVGIGDRLTINGETVTVTAIASATSLTVTPAISGANSGVSYTILKSIFRCDNSSNTPQLTVSDDGRIYGGSLHNNSGPVTGTTAQYIASGTYTPSLTNVTNVAASTAYASQWIRVGNVVTVSGKVDIDATADGSAATELGISLPIASNFAAEENLGGTATSDAVASLSARIKADSTNDRAAVVFKSISLSNDSYAFVFTYVVL